MSIEVIADKIALEILAIGFMELFLLIWICLFLSSISESQERIADMMEGKETK